MVPQALLILAVVAFPSLAEAQSFNCRYARNADEIAICDDSQLSRLDERMSRLFFEVRDSVWGRERAALDADQAEWLDSRQSCRRNPDCIEDAYRQRIRELRRY
jgi:uncharacterized protein